MQLIQRIDVNSLLKEVDMEELKLLATNTENMNMAFMNMLNRWESIRKDETAWDWEKEEKKVWEKQFV